MALTDLAAHTSGPRDHLPPHLRVDVPFPGPGGTTGVIGLADLVAFGAATDPDPAASAAWSAAQSGR